jgi:hypothetical protein
VANTSAKEDFMGQSLQPELLEKLKKKLGVLLAKLEDARNSASSARDEANFAISCADDLSNEVEQLIYDIEEEEKRLEETMPPGQPQQ